MFSSLSDRTSFNTPFSTYQFLPGEKSFDHFMAVAFLLEDDLGRSVELVTREALSPHLGPRILKDVEYVEIAD